MFLGRWTPRSSLSQYGLVEVPTEVHRAREVLVGRLSGIACRVAGVDDGNRELVRVLALLAGDNVGVPDERECFGDACCGVLHWRRCP